MSSSFKSGRVSLLGGWFPLLVVVLILAVLGLAICPSTPAVQPPNSIPTSITTSPILAVETSTLTSTQPTPIPALEPQQPAGLELVSQLVGVSQAVAVQGSFAYLAAGSRLVTVDISDPSNPQVLGQTEPLPGIVRRVVVKGNFAYIGAEATMVVVDVSDPQAPDVVGGYDQFPLPIQGLVLEGNLALIGLGKWEDTIWKGALWIIDVAEPSEPRAVSSIDGLGYVSGLAVLDGHAYLAESEYGVGDDGLRVVDISDPSAPRLLDFANAGPGDPRGVAVADGYAYIGSEEGLSVIDISDNANPQLVASTQFPLLDDLVAAGGYVYGLGTFCEFGYCGVSLHIFDVTTPSEPREFTDVPWGSAWGTTGWGTDLVVSEGLAYVARDRGLTVLDISEPQAVETVGILPTLGRVEDVVTEGEKAYLIEGREGFHVVDVTIPNEPVEVGALFISERCCISSISGLAVAGGYAYLAMYEDGLRMVGVDDPTRLSEVGYLDIPGAVSDLVVRGDVALLADRYDGLRVVDVSDPTSPAEIGMLSLPLGPEESGAWAVALAGDHAYAVNYETGLTVVDVSNPTQPRQLGFLEVADAWSIVAEDHYAYLTTKTCYYYSCSGFLYILDVSDPSAPAVVSIIEVLGGGDFVAVRDGLAYVAAGEEGVLVVDVGEPASPREIGWFDTPGSARAVAVSGGYVYVADGDGGLIILRISQSN